MKMNNIFIFLGILFGMSLVGCYKDINPPGSDPDGPAQSVSFKQDLAPLVRTKCGSVDGCHVPGAHKPYMNDDTKSFINIVSGGFVNTLIPKESIIYKQINGPMIEYIPSQKDRQKIYDWIRNGAPNN